MAGAVVGAVRVRVGRRGDAAADATADGCDAGAVDVTTGERVAVAAAAGSPPGIRRVKEVQPTERARRPARPQQQHGRCCERERRRDAEHQAPGAPARRAGRRHRRRGWSRRPRPDGRHRQPRALARGAGERVAERGGARVPLAGLRRERSQHHALDARGHRRVDRARRARHRPRRRLAAEQRVEDRAERVDAGLHAGRGPGHDLGRRISRRVDARRCRRRGAQRHTAATPEQAVLGCEPAACDAPRVLCRESIRGCDHARDRIGERQVLRAEAIAQRFGHTRRPHTGSRGCTRREEPLTLGVGWRRSGAVPRLAQARSRTAAAARAGVSRRRRVRNVEQIRRRARGRRAPPRCGVGQVGRPGDAERGPAVAGPRRGHGVVRVSYPHSKPPMWCVAAVSGETPPR